MTESTSIRILIVDDYERGRRGLAVALKAFPDLELVGEVSNGEEAIQQTAELQPDVILMDLVMPTMDGVTATRIICQKYPDTKVIALTGFDDKERIQSALDAGATHSLSKDASIDELAKIIRAASGKNSRDS